MLRSRQTQTSPANRASPTHVIRPIETNPGPAVVDNIEAVKVVKLFALLIQLQIYLAVLASAN